MAVFVPGFILCERVEQEFHEALPRFDGLELSFVESDPFEFIGGETRLAEGVVRRVEDVGDADECRRVFFGSRSECD